MAGSVLAIDESLVIIVDDRDAREALERKKADIDMMHTFTFLRWLAEDFHVVEAETAWQAIESA